MKKTLLSLIPAKYLLRFLIICLLTLMLLAGLALWGIPQYRIYQQGLSGQAELRKQEWQKKIKVEEAKAQREVLILEAEGKKEAALLHAEAEIQRAKGVAEANTIIGDSLENSEAYLRYLWIDNISDAKGQIIYVPTEANLPILEASR